MTRCPICTRPIWWWQRRDKSRKRHVACQQAFEKGRHVQGIMGALKRVLAEDETKSQGEAEGT